MDLDTDLAAIIRMAPGAVTVAVGAVSGYGVEDVSRYDLLESGGGVVERVREVLLPNATFALGTLGRDVTITVNGTARTIRETVSEDDGRLNRVICV